MLGLERKVSSVSMITWLNASDLPVPFYLFGCPYLLCLLVTVPSHQARQDITSAAEELAAVRLTKQEADEALLGKDKENSKVPHGLVVCMYCSQPDSVEERGGQEMANYLY